MSSNRDRDLFNILASCLAGCLTICLSISYFGLLSIATLVLAFFLGNLSSVLSYRHLAREENREMVDRLIKEKVHEIVLECKKRKEQEKEEK